MIIARFGIGPGPSKIEAITQLSQPSTVERGTITSRNGRLSQEVRPKL